MSGQRGSRSGGKGKSPRYSERYGANRPNPYTGYLPPGSAPAGQLYHPESVNMEKVSQMVTENAENLAAAAASRAISEAESQEKMEKEIRTNPHLDKEQEASSDTAASRSGGKRSKSRSRRRGGSSNRNVSPAISEEQQKKMQEIQDEAAAQMVAEVLSESIADAAESGSTVTSNSDTAADTADNTDWSNLQINTRFKRAGGKREEQSFDPAHFDEAEVIENPFDANYFSGNEGAERFVPPLDIFDDTPQDTPEESDQPQPQTEAPQDTSEESDQPQPQTEAPQDTSEESDQPQHEDSYVEVDWETPDQPELDDDSDMIIVDNVRLYSDIATLAATHERSTLRVTGESHNIAEQASEEQDDTLFVRQERVDGGTEVFDLPEGVRLPTYINDDEFLEQWLNEGEDMAIKDKRRRRRVSTIIGTVTMLFAMVGFIWVIQYAFGALSNLSSTDEAKDKYTDFITPVVMSEVEPFESWSAIPSEKLLQSAIFHVLTNMEESYYDTDDTNKIVIPSGDINAAATALYGDGVSLSADQLNILDGDDVYYSDTDDCFHVAATGISGPQPEIISISKKGSEVTLTVGYLDETGLADTDGYYMTMLYILNVTGDNMSISAIRTTESES